MEILKRALFPNILIITGLMAAGKSSVAQAIAERLPKSVHLRGDTFRKMIVNGRAEITPELTHDALQQLSLRYRLACDACEAYADAGFTVIYQDVILGEYLNEVHTRLSRWSPGVLVLNPALDVVARRDAERRKTAYAGDWTPASLAAGLEHTPRIGLWLDTSAMTVDETAHFVLRHAEATRAGEQ